MTDSPPLVVPPPFNDRMKLNGSLFVDVLKTASDWGADAIKVFDNIAHDGQAGVSKIKGVLTSIIELAQDLTPIVAEVDPALAPDLVAFETAMTAVVALLNTI